MSSPNSLYLYFFCFILLYFILFYSPKNTAMYLILGEVSFVGGGVFVGLKSR